MMIQEMFDKVYALPTNNFGVYRHERGALHVYKSTGPQFNILDKDENVLWNIIGQTGGIAIVPVENGVSQYDRNVICGMSEDVEELPMQIYRLLEEAGVL